MISRLLASSALLGVAVSLPGTAFAQAQAGSLAASPAAQRPDDKSQEIIVTARRRKESLKDVPASVAIVGATQLEQTGAKRLSDVQFSVPNVYFGNPGTQTQTAVTIRGVGDYSRNIGMDTRVSVYVDGVYVGNSLALNQQLLDLERVEVLRGPQGTLFGRNTVAGAINLITRKPDAILAGRAEVDGGSYGMRRLLGDLNVPLSDTLFIKVGGSYSKTPDYVRNLYDGSDVGGTDGKAGRVQLRWLASPSVKVDLSADVASSDYASFQKPVATVASLGPYTVDLNTPGYNKTRQWSGSGTISAAVGTGQLIAIASYRRVRAFTQNDEDAGPNFVASSNFATRTRQATGEIRYESSARERFRYVAGLYVERDTAQSAILATSPVLAAAIPANVLVLDHGSSGQTNYAAFADFDYDLTANLTAELGGRWSHDRKNIDFTQASHNPVLGLPSFTYVGSRGSSAFTPSGSLRFKASATTDAYVRVSTGYKSGGFNADVVASPDIEFSPEHVTAVEAGLKTELFDRHLTLDGAIFQSWHSDYQVFQFITPPGSTSSILQLRNAASARSRGFELEANLHVRRLTLTGGVGYSDATFTRFPNCTAAASCDGDRLPGSPPWTASASALYSLLPIDGITPTLFVQYSYRDATYTDVPNVASKRTQSVSLVNARVTFAHKSGVSVFGFVDNLLDARRIQSASSLFLGIPTRFYTEPRTWGAGLSYKF